MNPESSFKRGQFTEIEIAPNIIQTAPHSYKSEVKVDDLTYSILLEREKKSIFENSDWAISFDVEGTNAVTNKGMSVFQEVINHIENLVNVVKQTETIETISILASSLRSKLEDVLALKGTLQTKYENSPESFNGFECSISDNRGKQLGVFKIDNGKITETIFDYESLGLPQDESQSLEDFLASGTKMDSLLKGRIDCKKLMDYLHIEYEIPEYRNKSDASVARANLYEKVLKQKFPQYKIERDYNSIKVYLA